MKEIELNEKSIELSQISKEIDANSNKDEVNKVAWKDKNGKEKAKTVFTVVSKVIILLGCLYFFIVSLDLMSTSFRLVGGKYASKAFKSSVILTNPLSGLMIGIVTTVVVQSSSTSTSIIVSMVASRIIEVRYAIPIIMGANIGTSVTSVLVSLNSVGDKEKFRLSFSGATVHDMFNLLTVIVLLPIEVVSKYLERFSGVLVNQLVDSSLSGTKEPQLLNAITKPLTHYIIELDQTTLDLIAQDEAWDNSTLIKHNCNCSFIFKYVYWPEWSVGLLLLGVSLAALCICLILLVKILSSVFKGSLAKVVRKVVNSDFPGVFKYLTGLVAIIIGCGLTIIVQSSSVFTSTLNPLIGMNLISIERVLPLVLGANIGTTITGLLAAFSSPASSLKYSLQIALCHTLFNFSGIIIWYPIPFLRKVPIDMANFLGNTSAEYRWFAILYLISFFLVIPMVIFGVSLAGTVAFTILLTLVITIILFVVILHFLQKKCPTRIPERFRTWKFLPLPLRSLQPYDNFIVKYVMICSRFKVKPQVVPLDELENKESQN